MRRMIPWLFVVAAACGKGPAQPPVIEGGGGDQAGSAIADDPVAVLRVLAAAAASDDGANLDALIHPEHGLWVWTQPGAALNPTIRLTAGEAIKPSVRLRDSGLNDYWREALWPTVARSIEAGLPVLDRDPADRRDPKYGTCDDGGDGGGSAQRTWLATDDLGAYYDEMLAEAHVTMPPATRRGLLHFHQWGLDVYLMRDQGRLWVAHVMVWTPCDA